MLRPIPGVPYGWSIKNGNKSPCHERLRKHAEQLHPTLMAWGKNAVDQYRRARKDVEDKLEDALGTALAMGDAPDTGRSN